MYNKTPYAEARNLTQATNLTTTLVEVRERGTHYTKPVTSLSLLITLDTGPKNALEP